MTAVADDELPELTFDAARRIRTFGPFAYTVTRAEAARYAELTEAPADPRDGVPRGFATIFGRLGYLHEHRMPPGGLLLRQDIQWLRGAALDRPMEVGARVVSAEVHDGKRTLVLLTTASQDAEVVAQVRLRIRWPR